MVNELDFTPDCLSDRDIIFLNHISFVEGEFDPLMLNCGRGSINLESQYVNCKFGSTGEREAISQQVHIALEKPITMNGLGVKVYLSGWESISYIAIGYTEGGIYKHAKAHHPRQEFWFDFCIGFQDLAWGWSNSWDMPQEKEIQDVRFYIKGVPTEKASCKLSDVWVWLEEIMPIEVFGENKFFSKKVINNLFEYQKDYFPNYLKQAHSYMKDGACPLDGNVLLDWPVNTVKPPSLEENGTWQYSWHSLHPSAILLLSAKKTKSYGEVFAAREIAENWLLQSYYKPETNGKYVWYGYTPTKP